MGYIKTSDAIDTVCDYCEYYKNEKIIEKIENLPSVDVIDRKEALEHIKKRLFECALNDYGYEMDPSIVYESIAEHRFPIWINEI